MADICKNQGKKVLLVEGKDDCHVVLALCEYYALKEVFGIYQCENDDGILKRLNALIVKPDPPETIGVIIDADSKGVNNRLQQIKDKISDHKYSFSKNPNPNGSILQDNKGKPKIGIWIMPDNLNDGLLEDFLITMADKKGLQAAAECIEAVINKGVAAFKNVHKSKAMIHTYLAWQNEPGKPLGQSITAHALQPKTEIADIFIQWLKNLFY
ncbi:MAG: hypothetical protein JRJ49_08800 [Deltaproteobacteria bacterium]|nr:hypothetical protein [Deltaproteobacteria bacterium]